MPDKKQAKGDEQLTFEAKDDSACVSSESRKVRTVEQLLEKAKVDLNVWEVDHFIVNQWESARKDKSAEYKVVDGVKTGKERDSGKMHVQPLFQIKVWLKRKSPQARSLQLLLEEIEKKALPVKVPRQTFKKEHKRSLEICMMDVHLGLLCREPEADAPYDLEIAAETMLTSLEDLIARAEPFGPFDEVFMPFGNDFVHSDNIHHTTTAGTPQPESISWHRVFAEAAKLAISVVERLKLVAPSVKVYEIPGNHSVQTDFALAHVLKAYFAKEEDHVQVDASSSPYKFHRCGVNLIGYEHGHSVKAMRLPTLMANECREIWNETEYHEWHLGDQHRKGSPAGMTFEEQGVSVEYIPGLTAPNEWHRIKSFSHQKRGAMAYVWDWECGPIARFQHNISKYSHKPLGKKKGK
jgi:hypothetical protein